MTKYIFVTGGVVSGAELAPVYHRLSQAERERPEREQTTKKAEGE